MARCSGCIFDQFCTSHHLHRHDSGVDNGMLGSQSAQDTLRPTELSTYGSTPETLHGISILGLTKTLWETVLECGEESRSPSRVSCLLHWLGRTFPFYTPHRIGQTVQCQHLSSLSARRSTRLTSAIDSSHVAHIGKSSAFVQILANGISQA